MGIETRDGEVELDPDLEAKLDFDVDYCKIQSIMDELYWSYYDSDCPPTKQELQEQVKYLVAELEVDDPDFGDSISSGGFRVTKREGRYEIEFVAVTNFIYEDD